MSVRQKINKKKKQQQQQKKKQRPSSRFRSEEYSIYEIFEEMFYPNF